MGRRLALAGLLAGCAPVAPLPTGELPPEGAYTFVILPDTQGYVYNSQWAVGLAAQLRWITENAAAHDIRYVIQLGDIVESNRTTYWQTIRRMFDVLHDGDRVKVPYAMAVGNHDIGKDGKAQSRWTLMSRDAYFGPNSPYGRQPTLGGGFEGSTVNTWHALDAGDRKWLILTLEFGPRDEVLEWAGGVLDDHPDHTAIVVTHAYLTSSNARYQFIPYGGTQYANPHNYPYADEGNTINDGEEMWAKLIRKHANVRLVINGHDLDDGEGRLTSVGDHGQVVHQIVQNFQPGVIDSENGGSGWLCLLQVLPDGETVRLRTYSPLLDEQNLDPGHDFYLPLHDQPVGGDMAASVVADQPLIYYRPLTGAGTAVTNRSPGRAEFDGIYEGDGAGPWEFDGDDAIRTAAPLPGLPAWTVEAWVRPFARGSKQVVFTNDRAPIEIPPEEPEDPADAPGLGEDPIPPTYEFHDDVILGVSPEGTKYTDTIAWTLSHRDQSGVRTQAVASTRVLGDRWTHVVATGDGERLRLYLDGALAQESLAGLDEDDVPSDLALAAGPVVFGRSDNISGGAFFGLLGDVAVYDAALSPATISRHHLAAFSRVTAARLEVAGTADPDAEEYEGITLAEQGIPGLSVTLVNRGDVQVFHGAAESHDPAAGYAGGTALSSGEGVLLATVAQNGRAGVIGSASTGWNMWSQGILGVSTSEVGASEDREVFVDDEEMKDPEADPNRPSIKSLFDIELSVLNEVNIDVALAWFPFRGGWRGGHVFADGTFIRGNDLDQSMLRPHPDASPDDQRVLVDLDADTPAEGLLFAIGADGKNRVAVAAPRDDGPGWEVRIQRNSALREGVTRPALEDIFELLETPEEERAEIDESELLTRDSFSLLYIPLRAVNLVGGTHDGLADESRLSAGEFVLTRGDGPGIYHLEVTGQTPATGMLILTGADLDDPRNASLSYEDDGAGAFEIRAWEVETAAPRDTVFTWAFIPYNTPLELPK